MIAQLAKHNRQADGDHDVDTLGYWKWLAEDNRKLVDTHKQWLINTDRFDVISDSEKLCKTFGNV